MKRLFILARLGILLMLLMLSFGAISANSKSTEDLSWSAPVTIKTLNARIDDVESDSEYDEATQSRLVGLYRKSIWYLEEMQGNYTEAEKYKQAGKSAPKQSKSIREGLEQKKDDNGEMDLEVTLTTPFAVVQQHLFTEKANLAAVEAKYVDLELQLAFLANRATAILQQLNEAKQEQEKIFSSLEAITNGEQSPALIEAQKWALQNQTLALRSKIRMLDQELLSQPMRNELLEAQKEKQAFSIEYLSKKVSLLSDIVNTLRKKEAEKTLKAAEKAKREVENKHPVIKLLATENAKLSEELRKQTVELDRVTEEEELIKKQGKRISDDYASTKKKLAIAGLSNALGQMLMEQRLLLPDISSLQKSADRREKELTTTALSSIRYKEELRRIKNKEAYTSELTSEIEIDDMALVVEDLDQLMKSRQQLLEKMIDLGDAYFKVLGESGYKQQKLMETVVDYHDYLMGKLLWVRNSPYPDVARILLIPGQISKLISPADWQELARNILDLMLGSPALLSLLLIPLVLLWNARKLRGLLQETCSEYLNLSGGRISYTFKAIFYSILLSVPGPLFLAIPGWIIEQSLQSSDFSRAIGEGLLWAAPSLFYLRFIYVLCKENAVAEVHFNWPKKFLKLLRNNIKWLMAFFIPMAFVTLFFINSELTTMGGGLGRIFAVITQLILARFFYRLFDKEKGALQVLFSKYPQHPLTRFRFLWFTLSFVLVIVLSVFTFIGYVYTGVILTKLLLDSLTAVMFLIIIQQLGAHWLLIIQRRLANKVRDENTNKLIEAAMEKEEDLEGDAHLLEIEEPEIDVYALSQDSRKLLDAALLVVGVIILGWLWSEVLPALQFLDDFTLWYSASTGTEQAEKLPVTLADLCLAMAIAVLTIIAAKRLPAMLEIILLQLSTPSGSRYTITTLTNYSIISIGIVSVFKMLGVGWSQIQWLIAALGVGIGFGLQEIVANFICGIIILFERPVRVGDVVTVGDTDGVVTRIQIRATTIRNWDKKELLVPNKEFVTGRLLNWSLSDQVNRLVVSVGVAYGSDIQHAKALMLEVADEMECIMEDPKPSVTFESFGDNSLDLVLRCFLESLDNRLSIISSLHEEINLKFANAGINIAFPQRDIHLDTQMPLNIRVNYPDAQVVKPDSTG